MKDSQAAAKPSPNSRMPKPKLGIKKEKMAVKKKKEEKTPILKLCKTKKNNLKSIDKKSKVLKDNTEAPVKRKRGRPRKEDKIQVQIKKKVKEQQKPIKKLNEVKPVGFKRKLTPCSVSKSEKEVAHSPHKKPKISNDINCTVNGDIKTPPVPVKPCIQKGESPTVMEHTIPNSINSNGTVHYKKSLMFDSKKPLLKNATFHPPPRKDLVNGDSCPKSFKVHPNKNNKSVSKKESEINHQPKDTDKDIKKEAVGDSVSPPREPIKLPREPVKLPREPIKSHPQRMASLDAMAKMHVICTTDRKPMEHHTKTTSVVSICSQPFGHQKSLTQCHERIQFDVKKESKDSKGNCIHKEINFVKEKQEVFVSTSVAESSAAQPEQEKPQQPKLVGAKSQSDRDKKKKVKFQKMPGDDSDSTKSTKQSPSDHLKVEGFPTKVEKCKSKLSSKEKDDEKKCAKTQNKTLSKADKKIVKEKPEAKGNESTKKTKKVEQTKSEVKVKETIRMQKTCTYQSVTTVNTNATTNSVVPVGQVGMTANYSKTKKTVVTDEECKNKINFSNGSVINNSYCLTSDSSCAIGSHSDYCKVRTHPQIIPYAHIQTCPLGHSLNRTSESSTSSSPSHCDASFSVHRFSHQQPVVYSSPSDCGCCCSGSLVQNVHDPCLLKKSIVAYPRHLPHHTHLSTSAFTSETLCADYRPSNATLDASRHHAQPFSLPSSSPPPSHSRVSCCACCDLHRDNKQHHHQSSGNCLQFLSSPKNSASLVPCEQSPLDLSLASGSSNNSSVDSNISLQQGLHPSSLYCRNVLLLRTTTPHGFQHNKFTTNKSCCRCNKQITRENQNVETIPQLQCSNKNVIKIGPPHQPLDHVNLFTASVSQGSVPPAACSSSSNKNLPHIITDNFVTAKQEKSISPKQSSKVSPVPKKRQFAHGWSWKGKPRERLIAFTNDSVPSPKMCYPSIQHKEGDTIKERDCVLLKSGPKDTDLPYVAKVSAFWESPEDGEMMMSLLWYYRPEHTDQGRKPGQMEDEVFASRHKDVNSVACIEDKCYVLTYNEYCRYRASLTMDDDLISKAASLVPKLPDGYPRRDRLPNDVVSSDIVFICRHVYDFRQRRILKNPT